MIEQTQWQNFCHFLQSRHDGPFNNYFELHEWSITHSHQFWKELLSFFNLPVEGDRELIWNSPNGKSDFSDYGWFPKLNLNFAKILLEGIGKGNHDQDMAIEAWHESGSQQSITYLTLKQNVKMLQSFFQESLKLSKGDVLAAFMPNISETVVGMLSASSLGVIFTSTSCDFGISGVVDRFFQTKPTALIMATHYTYGGKLFDLTHKVEELWQSIPTLKSIILVDFLNQVSYEKRVQFKRNSKIYFYDEIMDQYKTIRNDPIIYEMLPFSHPLYVMYSSGTTGRPKCMVHSAGGTILQHLKEQILHLDFRPKERVFFFTTCGWMMWNWLVSALANRNTIVLFEGSPSHPSCSHFMKLVSQMKLDHWGTSPKFLRALEMEGFSKGKEETSTFSKLRTVISTGAPLLRDQYTFIEQKINSTVPIVSMSGGTDIIGCFLIGVRGLPIHPGELQAAALGMDVVALNSSSGERLWDQEGELACLNPFVSMPTHFINDDGNEMYRRSYFSHGQKSSGAMDTWYHGDYVRFNSETKGAEIFGRSDATLNPGGIRIGTAEIYNQTEKIAEIIDSLCVAKSLVDGDVEVWLFVKLKPEVELSKAIKDKIKMQIRNETTPRHVPKQIYAVKDIPYTRSGKKVEIAVAKIINGKDINNVEAIINPECLEEFKLYANQTDEK